MNKKEFYKNLMLTYTVDTEKVKRMAKRRVVKRSSNVLRILPTAAACAAVTAAAVTIVSLGSAREAGFDIQSDEALIARMAAAEQYYVTIPEDDDELMDMYVSFESPLSYNEIALSFSKLDESGDVDIILLYTEKGYMSSESISGDGSLTFLGAKIAAPASLCKDIRLLKTVSLVELPESGITDDSFSPFGSSELVTSTAEPAGDAFEVSIPTYTTTTTATTTTTTTTAATTTTTTAATTTAVTEDETDTDTDTEETTTAPDTESEETTDPVTEETTTTEPEETATDIEIPATGVVTVNIISADRIVVTTNDSIRLYRLENGELALETTFYVSNAKIIWKSYDGRELFITACDNGLRTRLYWADGGAGALAELDVSAITSDGAEISSVLCNQDGSVTLLRTVSSDKTRVYTLRRSEGSLSINLALEYDLPVKSLALIGDSLYFAITDTANSTITIAAKSLTDGTVTEVASYSGTLRMTRSQTLNSAALTFTSAEGEESCVLLTPDGELIETQLSNITFSLTSGRIFTDGVNYYYLGGGETALVSPDEEVTSAFVAAQAPGDYVGVIQEDGSAYLMPKE